MSAPPVLQIEDLSISYGAGIQRVEAVRHLSLDIQRGEFVAIVGESGSGKSTLAAALLGLSADNAIVQSSTLQLNGKSLRELDEARWTALRGKDIGFVPQDPGLSLDPVKRIGSQVIEALTLHGGTRVEARARARLILQQAGLEDIDDLVKRYPHEISGGMCQRVLIAMALANNPPLLIADEPTSALDVTVQRRILDHLQALVRSQGTAVLLITHDLGVAMDRADRVLVMRAGEIVEHGSGREIFDNPTHPYTRQLLAAAPTFAPTTRPGRAHHAHADSISPPLLRVAGISKVFGGATQAAVEQVSFEVANHSTLSIVGESGSGKSTTARLILGLEHASAGDIQFRGQSLAGFNRAQLRAYRREVQVVYQNPYASLDPRFDLRQIISEPLAAFNIGDSNSRLARARELLDRVGLPATYLQRRPGELSGGQRQRVAIARALALEPKLVVLDEPLSALDASVQKQIVDLLQTLQDSLGLSYLFISHDLAVVRQISDHVVVLRKGEVVEQGPAAALFASPQHSYTQSLLADVPGQRFLQAYPNETPASAPN